MTRAAGVRCPVRGTGCTRAPTRLVCFTCGGATCAGCSARIRHPRNDRLKRRRRRLCEECLLEHKGGAYIERREHWRAGFRISMRAAREIVEGRQVSMHAYARGADRRGTRPTT